MMKKFITFAAVAFVFAACHPSVNVTTPPTNGTAKFSNYLAIGNSLTAGYSDNSLTSTSQLNSFPERLFEQFSTIPGPFGAKGPFIQPLLPGNYGWPGPKLILSMTYPKCDSADSSLGPIYYPYPLDSTGSWLYSNALVNHGQINNIGVFGMRAVDYLVPGYAGGNPYAYRFYHNPADRPLDELYWMVGNLGPTFFTLWLGDNDVLGYALAGGQGNGIGTATPLFGNYYNSSDISPTAAFIACYDSALKASISTGASGALINIPDITGLPYFNTIPANGLILKTMTEVTNLKTLYGPSYDKAFDTGANYFIIKDHNNLTRQMVPGELLLLDTTLLHHIQCNGWGSTTPIPAQYVLTTDEIQNIRSAVITFNAHIQTLAQLNHLAYVDMYSFYKTLNTGYSYNGIKYTAQYVNGGAFSLDGIHFTQRGYALVANQIITTINSYYHSTIPLTDVNRYSGITFPTN